MKTYPLLCCLFFSLLLSAQNDLFHDESYKDAAFFAFKMKLLKAIETQDVDALVPILADTVEDGFGGCGACPKQEFINNHFSKDQNNYWWGILRNITRFGFARIDKNGKYFFQAPSWYQKHNSENELVVLGENVNVREDASTSSRVIAQLSFTKTGCNCSIVNMTEESSKFADGYHWIQIVLPNGKKGYIVSDFTSMSDGYFKELSVKKINGEWKITSFFNPAGC
ncbi:SH3 domain-containing protein [Ascidiimonas sp. W6]|uniref:SH3 domain-containing protein n=1 Tax=Ascidiimonas meishanensis TaxID=3128903 RepID=UPI0030ECF7A3